MRYNFTRDFYVPKGATKVADKLSDAIAYLSINARGKARATIFVGKQAKPISDFWYGTEDRRATAVKAAFENRRAWLARKTARREERKAFAHTVKVGDLYHTSWGYDQTNVEYFQVVEVKGKFAVLREIGAKHIDSGFDRGTKTPVKDNFLAPRYDGDDTGRPIRRLIQDGCIKIDDVRRAWPTKVGEAHSWTSYH
jgi:hypothetical protein